MIQFAARREINETYLRQGKGTQKGKDNWEADSKGGTIAIIKGNWKRR